MMSGAFFRYLALYVALSMLEGHLYTIKEYITLSLSQAPSMENLRPRVKDSRSSEKLKEGKLSIALCIETAGSYSIKGKKRNK